MWRISDICFSHKQSSSGWTITLLVSRHQRSPFSLQGNRGEWEQTWGSKGVQSLHCVCLDRRLGLSGSCTPRQGGGAFHPSDAAYPPTSIPPLPLDLDSVTVALQTVWGQRLTQQPHIRHGSSPLCLYKCWMANHPKIHLLECGLEFLQTWILKHEGRIIVAAYEVHKKNASCSPHRNKMT